MAGGLLNLIAYLQFRGLLKDLIGYQDSENPDENIQQFKIIYEKVINNGEAANLQKK